MMETVVSSKGQVVIPARLRRELGLRPGTRLKVSRMGDSLVLSGEESAFSLWLRERAKRPELKEPLTVDRSAPMPDAPEL